MSQYKRFWGKVDKGKKEDCWSWLAYRENGYGRYYYKGKSRSAHRVSWQLHNKKEVPKGKHILHKCDNPSCVNPNHLYLGDPKQNARDKAARGRCNGCKGIKNGRAKLTEQDVIKIRTIQGTYSSIAKIFNITPEMISLIKRNLAWQHIGE